MSSKSPFPEPPPAREAKRAEPDTDGSAASASAAPHLTFVVVGHVDHGKSTLIGRLLFDTRSVPDGKAEQIAAACQAEGMEFEYAFLLDALLEEQAQNVTMDTTRVPFRTARRAFTIVDAPGHKEFLQNMITGAASAEAAVLVVDASAGVCEQTRRHGYLLSLLGLKQIVVAVNKMDLVGYRRSAFDDVAAEIGAFLRRLELTPAHVVPIAAKTGEGLLARSGTMPWYDGATLLEALERFDVRPAAGSAPLSLAVQDVYKFDARRIVAAWVDAGSLGAGDAIEFHPGGKRTRVKTIETWPRGDDVANGTAPFASGAESRVGAGRAIAFTLQDEIYVERGYLGTTPGHPPAEAREINARVFWLHHEPLRVGDTLPLRLGTQDVEARIVAIARVLDAVTLVASQTPANEVQRHEVAEVRLRLRRPIVCGAAAATRRFVLMRNRRIAGGGIVDTVVRETALDTALPISAAARESLLGHRGAVIWLTGLPSSGKSTLATALENHLLRHGIFPVVFDGDVLRGGLCHGLGFTEAERKENIRRTAEAALLVAASGAVVITALISPFESDRDIAAERCHARGVPFAEVYVNAPLDLCERRDPKHLYRRARAGEIPAFTGITSPYEAPRAPALELHTDAESVEQCALKLLVLALSLSRPAAPDLHAAGADI